jgi:hypothetical protein
MGIHEFKIHHSEIHILNFLPMDVEKDDFNEGDATQILIEIETETEIIRTLKTVTIFTLVLNLPSKS